MVSRYLLAVAFLSLTACGQPPAPVDGPGGPAGMADRRDGVVGEDRHDDRGERGGDRDHDDGKHRDGKGSGMLSLDPTKPDDRGVDRLVAVIHGTEAAPNLHGTIAFEKEGDGIKVTTNISGLPAGTHGYHVHTYGDCSDPAAKSMGDHLDFAMLPHHGADHDGGATPAAKDGEHDHITGNLGELTPKDDGMAFVTGPVVLLQTSDFAWLNGRAIVIHAKGNDPAKPPTGDAGDAIACGVLGIAKDAAEVPASVDAAVPPAGK